MTPTIVYVMPQLVPESGEQHDNHCVLSGGDHPLRIVEVIVAHGAFLIRTRCDGCGKEVDAGFGPNQDWDGYCRSAVRLLAQHFARDAAGAARIMRGMPG